MMPDNRGSQQSHVKPLVITIVFLAIVVTVGILTVWGWKNGSLLRCHYRRMDTPLWRDERAPDGEEDPTPHDGNATSVVHNPSYLNEKICL